MDQPGPAASVASTEQKLTPEQMELRRKRKGTEVGIVVVLLIIAGPMFVLMVGLPGLIVPLGMAGVGIHAFRNHLRSTGRFY